MCPDPMSVATIETSEDHKIHALFTDKAGYGERKYIFVAIETIDNQIDFNKLMIRSKPQNG